MKKILVIITSILIVFSIFGQNVPVKRIAVLETIDKANSVSYGVKLMFRSTLTALIAKTSHYECYDRVDISSVISEHEFQRSGLVSDTQIKQLGEMTGAEYILINEIAQLDVNHVFIVSKIINVESAEVEKISEIQTTDDVDGIDRACSEVASSILGLQSDQTSPHSSNYMGQEYFETAVGLGMKMVYVEGGEFQMGRTSEQYVEGDGWWSNDTVIRRVKLDSFYIGEFEVTQQQWTAIMGTTVKDTYRFRRDKPKHIVDQYNPMVYVDWFDAQAFCEKLSQITGRTYCLPTEAQWEYAARGGQEADGTLYSGSNSIDRIAWYDENSESRMHPFKCKEPNGLGLYDMSGNVSEWCSDWYGDSYNKNDTKNPTGPSSGSERVLRGGNWTSLERVCRVSFRDHATPGSVTSWYGFRVVMLP